MTYVPIDEERFGDGQDDSLPASTGLHNHQWDNTLELAVEPRALCWSPICAQADITFGATSPAGNRPYAMHSGWLSLLRTRVYLPPQARKLILWIAHHVLTPTVATDSEAALTLTFDAATKTIVRSSGTWSLDTLSVPSDDVVVTVSFSGTASNDTTFTYVSGTGTDTLVVEEAPTDEVSVSPVSVSSLRVTGRVKLRCTLRGGADSVILSQTRLGAAGTPSLAVDRLEFDVDRLSRGVALLDVAVKSGLGDQQVGTSSSLNASMAGVVINDSSTGPIFFLEGSSGPDADALEVMVAGVSPGGTSKQWFDLLGVRNTSGKGGDHGSMALVIPPPGKALPFWPTHGETVALQELCYTAPRAIAFQVVCDRESVGRIDREELEPNINLLGSPAGRQVTAVRELLTRPRLTAIGPEGTLLAGDTDYTSLDYRRSWPRMAGSAAETALWSQSIRLTTPNPRLTLQQWVACINLDTISNADANPSTGDGKDKDTGKYPTVEGAGRAAWTFRLVVDAIDDVPGGSASWSTDVTVYGEAELDRVLTLHPAFDEVEGSALARSMDHISKGDMAYKEGAVSPPHDDDLVQFVSLSVDLAGLDDDLIDRPLRATLYAVHDAADPDNDYLRFDHLTSGAGPSLTTGPEARVVLVCGQFTLTEKPRAGEVLQGLRPELFLPGAYVRAPDAARINERLEYHWRRAGTVMPGRIYETPFQTTSTTYTTTNDAAGPDLDTWAGLCVLQRNDDGEYELRVQAYVQDLDVRLTITRFDDRMDNGTFSTEIVLSSSSGASELVEGTITLTAAQVHEGGSTANNKAAFYCTIDAKHNGVGTGYMWLTPDSREWSPPVSGPPTSWSYGSKTAYYSVRGAQIIEGAHLSGFLISNYLQSTSGGEEVGPKLIPDDGGAATWTMDSTGMSTVSGDTMGMATDGTSLFIGWGAEDGTFTTNGRNVLQKIDLADGTPDWTYAPGVTEEASNKAVVYMPTRGYVFGAFGDSADEIVQLNAATGAELADSTDSAISSVVSMGKDTGENYLIVAGANEEAGFWASTSTIANAPSFEVDFGTGSADVVNESTDFDGGSTSNTSPRVTPDRLNDHGFWISNGWNNTNGEAFAWHGNTDDGAVDPTTCVDIEINAAGDRTIPAGSIFGVVDHCVDNTGRLFLLVRNNLGDADVQIYDSDGTYLRGLDDDNETLPVAADGVIVTSIAINENFTIGITDDSGQVWNYPGNEA